MRPCIWTGRRRMRSGREAWPSASVAVIKAATGCLRHPRTDCGATAVQRADYRAATCDLQELAFVTVYVAEHFDRATHAQSNHACDVSSWPERDEPDPCPCVGSQGQTGNGRGAAKSTRM